jgi:hypothetical protein
MELSRILEAPYIYVMYITLELIDIKYPRRLFRVKAHAWMEFHSPWINSAITHITAMDPAMASILLYTGYCSKRLLMSNEARKARKKTEGDALASSRLKGHVR